jgi:Leucine-rich repeat (LRR) protein
MAGRGHPSRGAVARLIKEARATGATELVLSNLGLTALPAAIGQLSQLQSLDLRANLLSALPEAIGQLSQLQSLLLWPTS